MRKRIMEGAPAYMGLYSTLMILLLAFFIVINVFSKQKTGGMKDGIGQVKDAFGIGGGFGMHQFMFFKSGKSNVPVPEDYQDPEGMRGFPRDMMQGEGGVGTTDQDNEKQERMEYLRIRIPYRFKRESYVISGDQMKDYLKKTGLFLLTSNYQFAIRSYSLEYRNIRQDYELATLRAYSLMQFFQSQAMVPSERMGAVGYASNAYFVAESEAGVDPGSDQETYLYIYIEE